MQHHLCFSFLFYKNKTSPGIFSLPLQVTFAASAFDLAAQNAAAATTHQMRLAALVPQMSLNFMLALGGAATRAQFHWLLNSQSTSLEAFAPDITLSMAVSGTGQRAVWEAQTQAFLPSFSSLRDPAGSSGTASTVPPFLSSTSFSSSTFYSASSSRALYAPTVWWEPTNVNALGLDLGARAEWAAAIQASVQTSLSQSAPRLLLTAGSLDFAELFLLPLFANVDPACTNGASASWCTSTAFALSSGASNLTLFSANASAGLSSAAANSSVAAWIGNLVSVIRWAPVLQFGLAQVGVEYSNPLVLRHDISPCLVAPGPAL